MIKQNRDPANRPASLDPTGAKYLKEVADNLAIVNANKGKPWKKFSPSLVFKLYAANADVKKALSDLFGNKCAYCECSLDNQDLHTEHFRPKGEVDTVDHPTSEGYWWLAADWENMLPACNHCNRSPGTDHATSTPGDSGKGNRFPILPGSVRATTPGGEKLEKCALINPAVDEPSAYLSFKEVSGESLAYQLSTDKTTEEWVRADATISILGLNRPGLVRRRNEHLLNVKDRVDAYLTAAKRLNLMTKQGRSPAEIAEAKDEMDQAWDKIYARYLSGVKREYLHATIRCIEAEFNAAGLSLKRLLGGRPLYIPDSCIT